MRIAPIYHRSVPAVLGVANLLELGCFVEGRIQEISIKQVGGTPVAFTADVFSARRAYDPGVSSGNDPDTPADDVADPTLYRVVPQISALAGATGTYSSTSGQLYRNMDGGWSRGEYKIYIVLTLPSGAGDQQTAWDVKILGTSMPRS